jgi:flagellar basal-body rod modification protein FlgD
MSVDSISAYSAQTAAAAAASAGSASPSASAAPQISQADFLSLIVAQLQNQDPTQPTDPNQFVQELASLSEVSGIDGMQTSMSSLSSSMQSAQLLSGTSLIGREVLAAGSIGTLPAGGSVSGAFEAPAGTTAATVQVTDASGELVRTFQVAPSSGLTPFTWDGLTDSGAAAPPGAYSFSVTGDSGGTATSLTPLIQSKVGSVTIDPSTQNLTLNTDSGPLSLSSVVQVM